MLRKTLFVTDPSITHAPHNLDSWYMPPKPLDQCCTRKPPIQTDDDNMMRRRRGSVSAVGGKLCQFVHKTFGDDAIRERKNF